MKIFVISDIHGSSYFLKKALEAFHKEKADQILILGDELYHGPRNPLPIDYNPKEVVEILNKYKEKIIAVRGNCDSEVDQMLLEYPIMSDYSIIFLNGKKIFATHGHIYNEDKMPNLSAGNILIYGHT
ncbi:MAG: phosphodiesterase, partial [Cetobacterium sp.]